MPRPSDAANVTSAFLRTGLSLAYLLGTPHSALDGARPPGIHTVQKESPFRSLSEQEDLASDRAVLPLPCLTVVLSSFPLQLQGLAVGLGRPRLHPGRHMQAVL